MPSVSHSRRPKKPAASSANPAALGLLQLAASEPRFQLLADQLPLLVWMSNAAGACTYLNRGWAEFTGAPVARGLGAAWIDFVHPDDRARVLEAYAHAYRRGEPLRVELRLRRHDGVYRWMIDTAAPQFDGKKFGGFIGSLLDITERREAEAALHASEERLRLATHAGKIGLWDWDVVANHVTWTESLYEIHGVTRAQFTGTVESFAALVHPDDRAAVGAAIEQSLAARDHYEMEFRAVRPDGQVIWVFTNATVLREAGRAVRMSGATMDVTERKRGEVARRESEEKFRTLASHAPVGIFTTDARGDCLFVNESWTAMAGLTREQASGAGWTRAIHPDDRARVTAEWYASAREARSFALEYRFLRADGKVTWVQGSAVAARDAHGAINGYIGTISDITERKAAEFALRESEKRFRTVASRAPVGIFMTSAQGETIFVNDTWCAMAGLTAVQAQGSGWINAVHPDDRLRLQAGWEFAVRGGAPSQAEYRFLRPDGSVAWVQGSAVQLRDPSGRVTGYVGTVADITARKLAEDSLRQQAQHLGLALAAANLGDWSWDPATDALVLSPRVKEILGVTGEGHRREAMRELVHPDDQPRVRAANEQAVATKGDYDIEYRIRRPSGEMRWVAAKGRGVYGPRGELVRMMGVVQDITERKFAEQKLRAQEAQLRLISTNAPIILSHCSRDLRFLFVNRVYAERFQRKPEDIIGQRIVDIIGEAAMAAILPHVQRVLAGESVDYEMELPYRVLGPRFMRVSYVPDVAEDGTVRGWLSAISDLTERRRIEDALRASEAAVRVAQVQLQAHATDLERKVEERTASLRAAIGQMEEFSYSVSHDLRSPLRAMNAYAQALIEDYGPQLDATARSYLDRIQRSAMRMEKLTHDVLAYSRVARAEVQLAPVDLERLLTDLISQYAELQPAAADVEISRPLLPVLAHEPSLGQCLGNLLTNAAKFVHPGTRPHIRVTTEARGDRVRTWIEDDGIGIPPQYHGALFQVFERLPTPMNYEGTGIGLAIVRKAAERMGGTCGVESDGQRGSRFWVELAKGGA